MFERAFPRRYRGLQDVQTIEFQQTRKGCLSSSLIVRTNDLKALRELCD
jgi:hypothetical protein